MLIFSTKFVFGQCGNLITNPLPNSNSLLPPIVLNTNLYNVRVNFHFINKDDGTGNYSATNDPLPNDGFYGGNGFEFSNMLVKALNQNLDQNAGQNLNPSAPVIPIEHRFALAGVYFGTILLSIYTMLIVFQTWMHYILNMERIQIKP